MPLPSMSAKEAWALVQVCWELEGFLWNQFEREFVDFCCAEHLCAERDHDDLDLDASDDDLPF
jgi:hypothetical protein